MVRPPHHPLPWSSPHLWLRMYVMMVEKRQSNSRAVQGYTTGCNPAPEPPASRGNALSSWETGSERAELSLSVPKLISLVLTPASLEPTSECFSPWLVDHKCEGLASGNTGRPPSALLAPFSVLPFWGLLFRCPVENSSLTGAGEMAHG